MVGSSSCGFSVSRMSEVCSGGSSSSLRRLLAASFMKADEVKMVKVRAGFDRADGSRRREWPGAPGRA